jgi:hypothetical protein
MPSPVWVFFAMAVVKFVSEDGGGLVSFLAALWLLGAALDEETALGGENNANG